MLGLLLSACAMPPAAPVADGSCNAPGAAGVVVGSGVAGDPALPEPSSGFRLGIQPVVARDYLVVSANPLASQAGCDVLRRGGTAVDAAVAVQAVLGLVEPQSSGLGGGGFLLHFDAASGRVVAYDGREQAPAAADGNYLRQIGNGNTAYPLPTPPGASDPRVIFSGVRASGRSIGTPGIVRMLELAHRDNGKLPWRELFADAGRLATDGFRISGRLADAIAASRANLLADAEATAYFYGPSPDHAAKPLGTLMKNPAYRETLRAIADGGADALHRGPIARAIVDKIGATVGSGPNAVALTPGLTTLADLANYRAIRREPVCSSYRKHWVCGMPPPSSGGIAVAQILGILENHRLAEYPPQSIDANGGKPAPMAVHLISEAQRLAYADRARYVADTDFVPLPGGSPAALLDKDYLRERARLIRPDRSIGVAPAGKFAGWTAQGRSDAEGVGTTHVSIVDRYGNAVALTSSIEGSMGSYRMTNGFLLNNELTDFSIAPSDADGPIANRVGPGKRPRSSMAPTLVFAKAADGSRGPLVMATGSPGGASIIQFVSKTLIGVLDWGLDAQQATAMVNFGSSNTATTTLGGEHPNVDAAASGANDSLVKGLRALGHQVSVAAQSSGTATIVRGTAGQSKALVGGVDPRREGLALGD
ncbi:gamma-glutamyltransferase family protein [Piscinibacter sakaiensis]|uniref:gamma-glutamyltransferase family protein n=1 Tax=Piscinibacter sakaiensis TaxID=1547922 RepID=UPI003AAF25CE